MFTVRDISSGKYLRDFRCSFPRFVGQVRGEFGLYHPNFRHNNNIKNPHVRLNMWSADTVMDAKLYKTEYTLLMAFQLHFQHTLWADYDALRQAFHQSLPWLEIVKVGVIVKEVRELIEVTTNTHE